MADQIKFKPDAEVTATGRRCGNYSRRFVRADEPFDFINEPLERALFSNDPYLEIVSIRDEPSEGQSSTGDATGQDKKTTGEATEGADENATGEAAEQGDPAATVPAVTPSQAPAVATRYAKPVVPLGKRS
jgi:hypothetical protein